MVTTRGQTKGQKPAAAAAQAPSKNVPTPVAVNATVNPGQPSPTQSEGPLFAKPRPIPDEATTAARKKKDASDSNQATAAAQGGFSNPNVLCFRNSIISMLLHSTRIMSWIQHRHMANLTAAGLSIETYVQVQHAKANNTVPPATPAGLIPYTDVWCELYEVYRAFWTSTDQGTRDAAIKAFWGYLGEKQREVECPLYEFRYGDGTQHDAGEFLGYLLNLSTSQIEYFHGLQINGSVML